MTPTWGGWLQAMLTVFDCVEIVHDRAMAICVIALNRDVSSMSHCIEIISHSFSIFVIC